MRIIVLPARFTSIVSAFSVRSLAFNMGELSLVSRSLARILATSSSLEKGLVT